jgi:hypothetical protein
VPQRIYHKHGVRVFLVGNQVVIEIACILAVLSAPITGSNSYQAFRDVLFPIAPRLAGVAAGTGIAVLATNVLTWLWGV